MPTPKSRKQKPSNPPVLPSNDQIEDLEIQRRLRRDLKLTTDDIANIDIELAIQAGLLRKLRQRVK
jgi:hypothetical protein